MNRHIIDNLEIKVLYFVCCTAIMITAITILFCLWR